MKVSEICKLIDEGKTVLIRDNGFASNQDIDIDKNMIVEYTGYRNESEGAKVLYYTLETFREHNEKVAKPCYFDEDQKPTLTVFQTRFYKEKDSAWFMADDDIGELYTPENNEDVTKESLTDLQAKIDTILRNQEKINEMLQDLMKKLETR